MTHPVADPDALRLMARHDGRQLAFHLVLLGLAAAVAAVLVSTVAGLLGVSLALVVVALAAVAAGRFQAAHPASLREWTGLVRTAWPVWAVLLVVLFATRLAGGPSWLVWAAGLLALASCLVHAATLWGRANAPAPGAGTRIH